MEFLRFGSSIPGSYWGCCAVCIAQNFNFDPDTKASIELVDGDGGNPMVKNGETMFLGKTYREIFHSRLRIGTFNSTDKPNHIFLAVLTADQLRQDYGKKWLAILKETGFEFIRTTDNSVYSGSSVISSPGESSSSPHKNYLFGLFRNIGRGYVKDPYTPPKAWTDLPSVVPEFWEGSDKEDNLRFNEEVQEKQLELWKASSPAKFYSEEELVADSVPVTLAGRRSTKPQQLKSKRKADVTQTAVSTSSPFGKSTAPMPLLVTEYTHDIEDDEDYIEDDWCEDCDCGEC